MLLLNSLHRVIEVQLWEHNINIIVAPLFRFNNDKDNWTLDYICKYSTGYSDESPFSWLGSGQWFAQGPYGRRFNSQILL